MIGKKTALVSLLSLMLFGGVGHSARSSASGSQNTVQAKQRLSRIAAQSRLGRAAKAKVRTTMAKRAVRKGLGRPDRFVTAEQLTQDLFGPDAQTSGWIEKKDANGQSETFTNIDGRTVNVSLGWVDEMESKHLVDTTQETEIRAAMEGNDLERFVGTDLAKTFRAAGYKLVKQVRGVDTQKYKDQYFDVAGKALLASRQGISIRFRQVGKQIGTNEGMFEVKLYVQGEANSPVQRRIEIRFRTSDKYSLERLMARDPELEDFNPLAKLEKFDNRFVGQEMAPVVRLNNKRLEYQLRDGNDKPLYLFTLDQVKATNVRAKFAAGTRRLLPGQRGTASHREVEVEQMFTDESQAAKDKLREMTQAIESQFGLERATLNKPGMGLRNLGELN